MHLENEKISREIRFSSFLSFGFVCAEDLSFEINVDIAGYGRKTRHLLPRDPFPIPTISSKVEFYIPNEKHFNPVRIIKYHIVS